MGIYYHLSVTYVQMVCTIHFLCCWIKTVHFLGNVYLVWSLLHLDIYTSANCSQFLPIASWVRFHFRMVYVRDFYSQIILEWNKIQKKSFVCTKYMDCVLEYLIQCSHDKISLVAAVSNSHKYICILSYLDQYHTTHHMNILLQLY